MWQKTPSGAASKIQIVVDSTKETAWSLTKKKKQG